MTGATADRAVGGSDAAAGREDGPDRDAAAGREDGPGAGGTVAATKAGRHALIAQILGHSAVRSQTELRAALADHGVRTTQATLSRDLDELRAQKVRGPDGEQIYALPAEGTATPPGPAAWGTGEQEQIAARLQRWCAEVLVTADTTANQVVLRTPPGAAQLLASAIDHSVLPGVLGCIAGDDTVLVLTRDIASAEALTHRLLDLARRGRAQPGTGPGETSTYSPPAPAGASPAGPNDPGETTDD
ncbi:ArgR family transcriptional regulator [Georgenia sp. SYP-B2076]|uniref:arginine repressor n=1 Tax=Georgenia sp. SYP-B2076 TaxID=2495881 RepID=UPI000F8C8F13